MVINERAHERRMPDDSAHRKDYPEVQFTLAGDEGYTVSIDSPHTFASSLTFMRPACRLFSTMTQKSPASVLLTGELFMSGKGIIQAPA